MLGVSLGLDAHYELLDLASRVPGTPSCVRRKLFRSYNTILIIV